MPRDPIVHVFVGIRNVVVALDERTGVEMWRAELRSSDYVTVLWDGTSLFATNAGEVWRLDPSTGATIWHNEMKGLGRGLVSLASSRAPTTSTDMETTFAEAKRRRDAQAASAATG